jgi:hypothetical protein
MIYHMEAFAFVEAVHLMILISGVALRSRRNVISTELPLMVIALRCSSLLGSPGIIAWIPSVHRLRASLKSNERQVSDLSMFHSAIKAQTTIWQCRFEQRCSDSARYLNFYVYIPLKSPLSKRR